MAGATSGQDAEEAAELMATMRAEHPAMKAWFNDPKHADGVSHLTTKFGAFPSFWQDLPKWEGWKEARREYLLFTEGKSSNRGRSRKRRSRWADAGDAKSSKAEAPAAAPPVAAPAAADPVMAALGLSAPVAAGGVLASVLDKDKAELASL